MPSPGKGGAAPVYGHALGHATYERHRPEQTLLYQLVEKHHPALIEQLEFQDKNLPPHVCREFEAYLKCDRLEHGFLCVRCDGLHFERLVAFSCKKRGFCPSCNEGVTGVVRLDGGESLPSRPNGQKMVLNRRFRPRIPASNDHYARSWGKINSLLEQENYNKLPAGDYSA